jgi:predicted regulator of Ras-like GTPase activity (Roadblock/LC7/MglB family)
MMRLFRRPHAARENAELKAALRVAEKTVKLLDHDLRIERIVSGNLSEKCLAKDAENKALRALIARDAVTIGQLQMAIDDLQAARSEAA